MAFPLPAWGGYGAQSVGLLQALVGPAYTREILFTGRRFNGDEALRMGLINRLLPNAELAPYVQDYAAMISTNAPLTMRAAKLASIELLKAEAERDLSVSMTYSRNAVEEMCQ